MHHSNLVFSTYCAETGTRMTVEVPARVARRYIERHKLLPDRLEQWPLSALEELLEEVDGGDVDAWERTLILLAHHRSVAAMLLLAELEAQVPVDLKSFAELAFAESLGWLGYGYHREEPGRPPIVRRVKR